MAGAKRIVDIRGTQTGNKGAQLMLEAIAERMGEEFRLSAQTHLTDYDVRSHLGLRQTLHLYRAPRLSPILSDLVPAKVRKPFGLVSDSEIDAVLDASGFAYSDQWGSERARIETQFGRRQVRRQVPKILMPQALGPFEKPTVRKWSKALFEQTSLIFVRDGVSEKYVRGLGLSVPIERSPDFTIGLEPKATALPVSNEFMAIVPNSRIIDRGGESPDQYVAGLTALGQAASASGLMPLILVHETQDLALANKLGQQLKAPVYSNSEPRQLKYVLGQASAVISSRFHALVGALSQGVPSLAWGWSHKYVELLGDFNVPEWLVTGEDLNAAGQMRVLLSDGPAKTRLGEARPQLVGQVNAMWDLVGDAVR